LKSAFSFEALRFCFARAGSEYRANTQQRIVSLAAAGSD
jgi:hypothetical protein